MTEYLAAYGTLPPAHLNHATMISATNFSSKKDIWARVINHTWVCSCFLCISLITTRKLYGSNPDGSLALANSYRDVSPGQCHVTAVFVSGHFERTRHKTILGEVITGSFKLKQTTTSVLIIYTQKHTVTQAAHANTIFVLFCYCFTSYFRLPYFHVSNSALFSR